MSALMIVRSTTALLLLAASVLCVGAQQSDFLGRRNDHVQAPKKSSEAASDLLAELEKAVGYDLRIATEGRVKSLEEAVRPLFRALPQDGAGKIGADAVRYVLHRLFVQRHGWVVQGLETAGETWNSSSPVSIFSDHVDAEVKGLFEKHLNDHGFGVHQVAVMAATLESFVHQEVMERLAASYRVLGYYPQQEGLSEEEGVKIIKTYMMMYVLGLNHNRVTKEEMEETARTVEDVYPSWLETAQFVKDLRETLLKTEDSAAARTSWGANMRVLEEMSNRYGSFQNRECRSLKKTLLGMEEAGSGRVSLDKFYGSALSDNTWQFLESVPYLQQLGALDDSDERRMRVIIPNYMTSLTNCLASSKFYSVCCIDECDPLLQRLEEAVGAPESTPKRLAELVGAMPSDTTEAPRQLSKDLLLKLDEVAETHGGKVPLHSRLFAQWMHHAFPRECPYPHRAGTTTPYTPDEWISETGAGDSQMTDEEMLQHIRPDDSCSLDGSDSPLEDLPWSYAEELLHASDFYITRSGDVDHAIKNFLQPTLDRSAALLFILFAVLAMANFNFSVAVRKLMPETVKKEFSSAWWEHLSNLSP